MASNLSPSSYSPQDDGDLHHIPTALALPAPNAVTATRRLPPPCWAPDETVALIEAYRDKWYSLHRSNLRANDWQEVAADVASRCPASPPKTAVQCRHKMEKLRKRYRAEIQRAVARGGVHRYTTAWAHFQNMHSMEKGPNSNPTPPSSSSEEEEDYGGDRQNSVKRINDLYNNHAGGNRKAVPGYQQPVDYGSAPGIRVKIQGGMMPPMAKAHNMFDEMPPQQTNPRFPNSFTGGYGASSNRDVFTGQSEFGNKAREIPKKRKADGGVGGEVAAAIQALGEGFMRMEKVKMDMAKHIEEIRMDMEMKRTEMILESQQRIVEAFAKGIAETSVNKKGKRMQQQQQQQHSMPDC